MSDNLKELGMRCIWEELLDIELYSKLHQITPFVGEHYHDTRVLLVCKNFAVPSVGDPAKQLNEKCQKWHEASKEEMSEFLKLHNVDDAKDKVFAWLRIRGHLGDQHPGWIWHKLADCIIKSKSKPFGEVPIGQCQGRRNFIYKHLAFMNYVTRPGTEATDIVLEQLDKDKSYEVFIETVNTLKPEIIFFFGKWFYKHKLLKGYKRMCDNDKFPKVINPYSPFARRGYWNSWGGKELFINELEIHMKNKKKSS